MKIRSKTLVVILLTFTGLTVLSHLTLSILLDLSMPKLSGREVMPALLAMNPAVRVIITSGYVVNLHDLQGAKAFCNKPFNDRELLQTVRSVLDADFCCAPN